MKLIALTCHKCLKKAFSACLVCWGCENCCERLRKLRLAESQRLAYIAKKDSKEIPQNLFPVNFGYDPSIVKTPDKDC